MIRYFLLTIFLGGVFVALTQDLGLLSILTGLGVGFVVVTIFSRLSGRVAYFARVINLFRFLGYFFWILVRANLQVAREIITPGFDMTPRIIRYSVEGMATHQITTLANAITLTPGTLTIDLDEDRSLLYVHCMYAADRDEAIDRIDRLRHRLMREVFGQ